MGRVMSTHDALTAATRDAARMLGLEREAGTLTAGKIADLIAVSGDPRRDLSVLQRVGFVMRSGHVVRHQLDAAEG